MSRISWTPPGLEFSRDFTLQTRGFYFVGLQMQALAAGPHTGKNPAGFFTGNTKKTCEAQIASRVSNGALIYARAAAGGARVQYLCSQKSRSSRRFTWPSDGCLRLWW
jgi:hypothetical protein